MKHTMIDKDVVRRLMEDVDSGVQLLNETIANLESYLHQFQGYGHLHLQRMQPISPTAYSALAGIPDELESEPEPEQVAPVPQETEQQEQQGQEEYDVVLGGSLKNQLDYMDWVTLVTDPNGPDKLAMSSTYSLTALQRLRRRALYTGDVIRSAKRQQIFDLLNMGATPEEISSFTRVPLSTAQQAEALYNANTRIVAMGLSPLAGF